MVVNCTADNPFVDPIYVDRLIDFHVAEGNDFTRIEGLPFGTFSYAVSRDAMFKAIALKDEEDTEVWGNYFTETGKFKWGALKVTDQNLIKPDLRLTVDTPEDFAMVTEVFKALYRPGHIFPLVQIIDFLERNPRIRLLNSHIQQKKGIPIKVKA